MTQLTIRRGLSVYALQFALTTSMLAALAPAAPAQFARSKNPGFWVAAEAEVPVKPDRAIVLMMIRSCAPTASMAVTENDVTANQIENALDGLGLKGHYRLSTARFESPAFPHAPNPAFAIRPAQGFPHQVAKYVFVTFEGDDIERPDFEQTIAQTIDALTKAGAQPVEFPQFGIPSRNATVLFTIEHFETASLEANRLAASRARSIAEAEAKSLGVRITGILDARVNRPLEVTLPRLRESNVFDDLQLRYFSTSKDNLRVSATFAAEYAIR